MTLLDELEAAHELIDQSPALPNKIHISEAMHLRIRDACNIRQAERIRHIWINSIMGIAIEIWPNIPEDEVHWYRNDVFLRRTKVPA